MQRGKTPVVVGGTGFYLRWYIYGKPNTPVSNGQLAAAAQAKLDKASTYKHRVCFTSEKRP